MVERMELIAERLSYETPLAEFVGMLRASVSIDCRTMMGYRIQSCLLHNAADRLDILGNEKNPRPWASWRDRTRDAWNVFRGRSVAIAVTKLGVSMRKLVIVAALASSLAACASTSSYVPPPVGNERAEIYMIYGAGGQALSGMLGPGQGTLGDQITAKFGSAVRIAGYYDWTDYSVIQQANAVPSSKRVIFIGDSCGSSIGPFDAAAMNRPAEVIGVQASIYCPTIGFTDPVPATTSFAEETYNKFLVETGGLGYRLYTAGPSTKLTIVQRPDLHPGLSQDFFNDCLDEISTILASSAKLHGGSSGGTQMLIRYHGQRIR
jgi:hypothetical protein